MIRAFAAAVLALLLTQLTSCVGGAVGVSSGYPGDYWSGPVYDYDVGYVGAPAVYGGWGPGYLVGPPRWGGHPVGHDPGYHPNFRPAAPGRAMPSIPAGARGGGMRGAPGRR